MANRKLNSIKFPDIADTYILDADKVNYDDSETYASGSVGKALQNKAEVDGSYESMTVGNAEQLVSNVRVNDKTPYLFRTSGGSVDIGDREYVNGIVGGTVAWNQWWSNYSSSHSAYMSATKNADNDYTFTSLQSGGEAWRYAIKSTNQSLQVGHKYLFMASVNPSLVIGRYFIYLNGSRMVDASTPTNTWSILSAIVQAGSDDASRTTYAELQLPAMASAEVGATYRIKNAQLFDLTQMFGSTIADYIYSLETANAGAGVAWFKKLFNKPYYAYNAGELKSVSGLVSHDMTGFNQWDEEWENGYYNRQNGVKAGNSDTTYFRSKNYIPCLPNTSYYFKSPTAHANNNSYYAVLFYDADKSFISADNNLALYPTKTTPKNAYYMTFYCEVGTSGATYKNDICINIAWDNSRNGEYEPYELHSYPLDSDLELRGIPKLDASNNLYYDGDVYESDGTVTRKYGIRAYQSGDESDTSVITDKTNTVYPLQTPTTETADPYTNPQIVNDFGTEEFVISNTVAVPIPVGNNTDYPINLKAQVEMMPHSPDGDGDYIVRQTNGTNEYVSIANNATIQNILARLEALEG